MTMLSPAATFHAELREQLGSVGRALSMQRALQWLARGLAVGTVLVLGLVIWAWLRDGVSTLPLVGLVALPVATALLAAVASLFIRHKTPELARRIDSAARLQERSTTALELGASGAEYPLALAQMRDAVEHLRRVDMLDAFPLRLPKHELMAAFFVTVVAAIIGISPNPWLLRARAANPAISIAREQAQRVQRVADSISPQDSAELESLRQLVSKGAKTIDARSNEPDSALNALQDLEEQVRQMGAGDDQLAAALAAISSALASDPSTSNLSTAINTGDMREISQALQDLAQQTQSMSPQDAQRVSKVLRDASNRAGRVSQSVSGELSDAADALGGDQSASDAQMGDPSQAGQAGAQAGSQQGQQGGANGQAQNGRSASDALNQLSSSAAAAGERQRAASQLESSRNALERALGRTQSRSGSTGRSSSSSSSSSRSQTGAAAGQDGTDQGQGAGQGQAGDQGDGADGNTSGAPGNDQGQGGDTGQGGGFSQGGQSQNRTGGSSSLDAVTSPQQVPGYDGVTPDESQTNPYASEAGDGTARASDESVQPSFSRKPTQGNDNGSIPLGLRDLVKDYFSSLDQNQK
jgi:hypothetical protein